MVDVFGVQLQKIPNRNVRGEYTGGVLNGQFRTEMAKSVSINVEVKGMISCELSTERKRSDVDMVRKDGGSQQSERQRQ